MPFTGRLLKVNNENSTLSGIRENSVCSQRKFKDFCPGAEMSKGRGNRKVQLLGFFLKCINVPRATEWVHDILPNSTLINLNKPTHLLLLHTVVSKVCNEDQQLHSFQREHPRQTLKPVVFDPFSSVIAGAHRFTSIIFFYFEKTNHMVIKPN